jgi:hypothetical protein
MDLDFEWNKLLVLGQLSELGRGQFQDMPSETQEALVYDAMVSSIFKEVFPTIQA